MKTLLSTLALAACLIATAQAAETNAAPVSPSVAKNSRCFQLRIYQAPPGKLEELNKLLRDHAVPFFKKHGIEVVGFWIPTDKDQGAENKVIYLLAHPNRAGADKNWAAFRADPEWRKAMKASEANGKLTEKVESIFMAATDYSAMK